nr:SurA N-terminal domain-containing protein [Hydrogenophaga sp.]
MTEPRLRARRYRLVAGLCLALLGTSFAAHAQSLRMSRDLVLRAQAPVAVDADFIVALVNSEPVTNHEVRQGMARVRQQLEQRGGSVPPSDQLAREVLEQLVSERAMLQHAVETGVRVDEASLLQAEQAVAAQNGMGLDEFRRRLSAERINPATFREDLRRQILMQRLREREVQNRVQVSEGDIDDALRARRAAMAGDPS